MAKTSRKAWLLVPLLAFVMALGLAPAAFADVTDDALAAGGLNIQSDDGNGIGKRLNDATFEWVGPDSYQYTGQEIKPAFKLYLDNKELRGSDNFEDLTADYWYFYLNNTDVSTGVTNPDDRPMLVICTFDNEDPWVYTKQELFTITAPPTDISDATVTTTDETYTGKKLTTTTIVVLGGKTLVENVDYTVKYKNNKKVGTATATLTGIGNYTGSKTATFKIVKASIANAKFIPKNVKDKVYNGKAQKPKIKVKYKGKLLKQGRDYKVKYVRCTNVGTACIVVTGKGNLRGTHKIYYAITPRSINDSSVTCTVGDQTWTGSPITPNVTVKYKGKTLSYGKDYRVTYGNNVNAGLYAKAYVTGIGNFSGSRTCTFAIKVPIDTYTNAYMNYWSYPWTGSPIEPYWDVIVEYNGRVLKQGFDYTLVWKNNINKGTNTASVTIKGMGVFTGSRTLKFSIV